MSTTPIEEPEGNWWDIEVGGYEKLWLGITILWAVMLFGWMAGWTYMGEQNPTGKTYRVTAERYQKEVNEYRNEAGKTEDGFLIPPGEDVYVAAGISGAIQHKVGMDESDTIVAVNTDPEADIRDFSDYFVEGDLFEVLPRLTEAVERGELPAALAEADD